MERLIDNSSNNSDENVCNICYENFDEENGDIYTMKCCNQQYHNKCINEWLHDYSSQYSCPHCRQDQFKFIQKKDEDSIEDESYSKFCDNMNKCFNLLCCLMMIIFIIINIVGSA